MKEITEEEMLRKAAAYCAEAERCRGDVEKKIARAGLEAEAAERILARLEKEGFIDDERYCRFFVNDKLRFNKWGRMKIALELRKKGIPAATYENALRNIDEEEYILTLTQLLRSKKRTTRGKDARECYYKLLRFAAGRGFEPALAGKCLRDILGGEDYEENLD